ncbi:hypothetical protein AAZX31_11G155500 [Glycine max]
MDFPKDKYSRHFSSSNYIQKLPNGEKHKRKWLIYSRDLDRVFCFCCKLFNVVSCTSKLANEGSKDWRNLRAKLKSPEITNEITNMNAWIDLEMRLEKNKTIDKDVQEQINRDRKHGRNVLLTIVAAVKTLGKNNLAFREKNEKIYQKANGNFLDAKYYAIILECTPNISYQEQMPFVLRCVDISSTPIQVNEYFLEFLKVDDTSGKGLFDAIIDELKIVGLDINDLRGQGYDNGSNMKRKLQGVQQRFLDINPRSFYTPCGCHSLNLVLCDMANFFPKVTPFFESRIKSVKAVRFQILQIRDALFELSKASDDPKIKSMTIWYDILFAVNLVPIEQLKGLLSFFEKYRENGFENALISTKEIAFEMDIEPKVCEKRISRRKKQFDENVEDEINKFFSKCVYSLKNNVNNTTKIIKTYLRSTMSQQKLNGLTLLSIKKRNVK